MAAPYYGPSSRTLQWTEEELLAMGALELPPDVTLRTFHDLESLAIAPVFRRQNLPKISIASYEAFKPTLQLATMFLSEPNALGYWLDLAFAERVQIPNRPKGVCEFRSGSYGPEDIRRFYYLMDELKDALVIRFKDHKEFKHGLVGGFTVVAPWYSSRRLRLPSFPGYFSKIILPKRCLEEAEAATAAASARGLLDHNAPSICLILRQRFNVAVTLCHEVCHALRTALETHPLKPEPFYNDDSHAEVGNAWEASTFGGSIDFLDESGAQGAICVMKWPGAHDWNAPSRRKSRRRWLTSYVVPMDYIIKVQSRAFWERDVRRFGPGELRVPKMFGIRFGSSGRQDRVDAESSAGSSCEFEADSWGRVVRAVPG
ncbi:MAG: hypothetical protein M1836_002786 [Candelina mexicana]|nr:MAG: hypothetical protein M1836_002786 [Candelina mexicana]